MNSLPGYEHEVSLGCVFGGRGIIAETGRAGTRKVLWKRCVDIGAYRYSIYLR